MPQVTLISCANTDVVAVLSFTVEASCCPELVANYRERTIVATSGAVDQRIGKGIAHIRVSAAKRANGRPGWLVLLDACAG